MRLTVTFRGTRIPKVTPPPKDWAKQPPEKQQQFLEDKYASVVRELRKIFAVLL